MHVLHLPNYNLNVSYETYRNLVTMYYIEGNVRGIMNSVDISLWQRSCTTSKQT